MNTYVLPKSSNNYIKVTIVSFSHLLFVVLSGNRV